MKRILLTLVLALMICSTASAGFIGNSNVGGDPISVGSGCWYYQRFTADSTGTVDSIRLYGRSGVIGGETDTIYLAFYAIHATYDTLPGALLWVGRPDSIILTSTAGWHKLTFTGVSVTAGVKYCIAYGGRSAFQIYKTSGATSADSTYGGNRCTGFNNGAFVDPSGATSSAKEAMRGLQVFYTTSGGPGPGGGNGLRVVIQKH